MSPEKAEPKADVRDLFSLAGKTSVVTGGSGSLGQSIALALAQAGSNIVLLGRNLSKLERASAALSHLPVKTMLAQADVLSIDEMEKACSRALSVTGKVDVLVNAHGINIRVPTVDMALEDWERIVDTNLKGAFISCQVFGRHMIKQPGGGKIVNISSTAGSSGYRWGYSGYSPSKAGVDALTRTLAVEWGRFGVNVNGVAPYFIYTDLTQKFLGDPKVNAEVVGDVPLGRLGRTRDILGPVLFLASPASDWITGQTIMLDGGYTAH